MTHVITRACCNDAACVPVCPVNCIHPTPDEPDYRTAEMLYIDPQSCIDCGACVETCPVGAIQADYDLSEESARYEGINARYYETPGRRDYEEVQNVAAKRDWSAGPEGTLRVAVVGSGPSAFYAAEEILSQRGLEAEVDMFERLPVPWGLVRAGVAPDHQDTKAAADPFNRTARRKGFRMFLNTEIGRDISPEQLQERYHAVVYAVGALGERTLGVPGEDLPGSHSATAFVSWYNGHPDFSSRTFDLSCERAVIIGNGNVALDVARVLLSDPDRLAATDIADHALEALRSSKVREVVVVGRRGAREAAFTTPELLGLLETEGIDVVARPDELGSAAAGDRSMEALKVELLEELCTGTPTQDRRISLRFLLSPVEILGEGWVEGVRLVRNRLEVGEDGRTIAVATADSEELACGLVFRSVGYLGEAVPGLPFDESRGVVPNDGGRVAGAADSYVTGWIKRGPSGVIGTNKKCAKETVAALFDDYVAGRLTVPVAGAEDVADLIDGYIDLQGWKQLDDHERKGGKGQRRPRVKIVDREQMVAIARGGAG
ncbi:4Fe-4S binding protein [Nocardioides ultimimeridianus]